MDLETFFKLSNLLALIGWLLLIASRWLRPLRPLIGAAVIPLLLGIAYVILISTAMPGAKGGFDSLPNVEMLFENRAMVMAGWLHYLAFDLLVGTWIWRDSERAGIAWWAALPCLFFTFMFGPAGIVLYAVLRGVMTKSVSLNFGGASA